MKVLLFIGCLGLGVWITGCGSTQSVSSTSTTSETDSIVVKSESRKDSSSSKTTIEPKIIPGSSVDVSVTPGKLDSLIKGLKGLPTSVNRTIYLTDPKLQTRMTLLIDSLGNAILRCSDRDEMYYQVTRELTRLIETQKQEIERLSKKETDSKLEIIEKKKSFFQEIWDAARWIFIALIAVAVISCFLWIKSKFTRS